MDYIEKRKMREELFYQLFGHLSQNELNDLLCVSFVKQITKGSHIARAGEIESGINFLYSGCFRFYNYKPNMQELTDILAYEKGQLLMGNISLEDDKSMYELEALAPSLIVTISYSNLRSIFDKHQRLKQRYISLVLDMLQNQYELQCIRHLDAKTRIKWFSQRYADVKPLILKKIIASFLDMDQATYSRLNKESEADTADEI